MMTTIWSASLTMRQGSPATTKPATTQNPSPATKQDVQASARDFGDAIRNSVQQEVNAALSQSAAARHAAAAAQAQAAQAGPVLAPTSPTLPTPPSGRTFQIRGPDGTQTITIPPHAFDNTIPPQAVDMTVAFFLTVAVIIIGLPLARAFARRMDRRGGTPQVSNEVSSQLAHLNQAVDAIALEVERISEGQRFTTRLLSEQRDAARQTLPSGVNR
jgi:hypothetical protein